MHVKLSHSSLVLCGLVVVPMINRKRLMSAWEELGPLGLHCINVFVFLSSDCHGTRWC